MTLKLILGIERSLANTNTKANICIFEGGASWFHIIKHHCHESISNYLHDRLHIFYRTKTCKMFVDNLVHLRIWRSRSCTCHTQSWKRFNILRPRQNGRHFTDDIFVNEEAWISVIFSLKFVSKFPVNNIPKLVQIMAWCRSATGHYLNQWWPSLLTEIRAHTQEPLGQKQVPWYI